MSNLRSSFSSGAGLSFGGGKVAPPSPPKPMVAPITVATPVSPPSPAAQPATDDQLATAEKILDEIQSPPSSPVPEPQSESPQTASAPSPQDPLGGMAQAVTQSLSNLPDPLNPASPTPVGKAKKEAYQVGVGVSETPAPTAEAVVTPEYPTGVQAAEQEPTPEITPEVESFLERVEEQPDQLPQEIVVADNQEVSSVTHHPKQPVVVLPITAQDQQVGKNKDFSLSLRWLVEWSLKMIKKFSGKIIYREAA